MRHKLQTQQVTVAFGGTGSTTFLYSVSNIPNIGEFTVLFDLYRIMKVSIKMTACGVLTSGPLANLAGANLPVNLDFGRILHLFDMDSAVAPLSEAQFLEYDNVRVSQLPLRRPLRWSFRPRQLNEIRDAGGATALQSAKFGWMDLVSTTVQAFPAVHLWIVNGLPAGPAGEDRSQVFKIDATLHVAWRGRR